MTENKYTVRKLGELRAIADFEDEQDAIERVMMTGFSGIGIYKDDKELRYIVHCGEVFGRIQPTLPAPVASELDGKRRNVRSKP